MTIETFARQHRLRIRHVPGDGGERGDPIIPGSNADGGERQLYFDDGQLCLMILNGVRVESQRWKALGGKLWLGTASSGGPRGRWIQDVKITGIPLENTKLAIRLARVRRKREISEAERTALIQKLPKPKATGAGQDAD